MLTVKIFLILSNSNTVVLVLPSVYNYSAGYNGDLTGKKTLFMSLDVFQKMPSSLKGCA